jgi:hypothetical protein
MKDNEYVHNPSTAPSTGLSGTQFSKELASMIPKDQINITTLK